MAYKAEERVPSRWNPEEQLPLGRPFPTGAETHPSMAVSISQVLFEHHRTALGIGESSPRLSWRFEGDAREWEQTAYDLEIQIGSDGAPQVYSVNSSESILVPWPANPLESAQAATVKARAHGKSGQPSTPWSEKTRVEVGLLTETDWAAAAVIAADKETEVDAPHRPVYFRKTFSTQASVTSARLYITALGIYEAEINGVRVGDLVMSPGWQSYNHRHVYDTYDVTDLVAEGENAIGVVVGEGWFSGRLGYGGGRRNIFGDTIGMLALLTVTFDDGTKQTIPTDTTWTSSSGPLLGSEIYDGETYDSRLEQHGWSAPSFQNDSWTGVKQLPPLKGRLSSPDGPQVRRLEERAPATIFKSRSGKTVVDFGQNLVGWVRLTVDGPAGQPIQLLHTEVMENGEVATRPLRLAKATDTFVLSGNGTQTWEPRFTFHGFRYVQVTGWPENSTALGVDSFRAIVIHSDMEQTGWFECSHGLLNKFHENVRWSMKGNFLSIPTDCPQRDERLGWTGDAHAFGPTADFLYDTAGFWRGWLKDVKSEQFENDSFVLPFVVPDWQSGEEKTPVSIWGDVVVAGPWDHYQAFGDREALEEQYVAAQAWIDKGIKRNEVGLWDRSTFQFADWLDPLAPADSPGDATTDKHLVSDAYLIRMTELLANMSDILGYQDQASIYREQHQSLTREFQNAWMSPSTGLLANETQTALTLALRFGLLPSQNATDSAAARLRSIIANNNYKVGTGFAGTPHLGHALTEHNATPDFYKMLLQTEVPSWLFQVVMNGTTTWERWDSMYANGSVNAGEMTSFNHYAFGSVSSWIHAVIGGISPASPGYKEINIAPVPGGGITTADTRYLSPYGMVEVKWSVDEANGFKMTARVPPNTKAYVTLPGDAGAGNGTTASSPIVVGSGAHEFSVPGLTVSE